MRTIACVELAMWQIAERAWQFWVALLPHDGMSQRENRDDVRQRFVAGTKRRQTPQRLAS
jgi:hypothetical protein